MRPFVRVQHIDRAEGGVVGTFNPLQPRFAFRANDIGDISYELALSNTQVTRDAFAPKRTDFRLQVSHNGAQWHNVMGGFHWVCGLNNEEGTVQIQGQDWLAYLEQPMWFDAYMVDALDLVGGGAGSNNRLKEILNDAESWGRAWVGVNGTDTDAVKYNQTQQTVVTDLVESIAHGDDGTLQINTSFQGDPGGWGEFMNYTVMFQDNTNVLDHIRAISNMDAPFGFDFFMNWDKTLILYNPAKVSPIASINPVLEVTRSTPGLVKTTWQNDGPMATWTVALGPGNPAVAPITSIIIEAAIIMP